MATINDQTMSSQAQPQRKWSNKPSPTSVRTREISEDGYETTISTAHERSQIVAEYFPSLLSSFGKNRQQAQFAEQGFYFQDDTICCMFCHAKFDYSSLPHPSVDRASTYHRMLSPNCFMFRPIFCCPSKCVPKIGPLPDTYLSCGCLSWCRCKCVNETRMDVGWLMKDEATQSLDPLALKCLYIPLTAVGNSFSWLEALLSLQTLPVLEYPWTPNTVAEFQAARKRDDVSGMLRVVRKVLHTTARTSHIIKFNQLFYHPLGLQRGKIAKFYLEPYWRAFASCNWQKCDSLLKKSRRVLQKRAQRNQFFEQGVLDYVPGISALNNISTNSDTITQEVRRVCENADLTMTQHQNTMLQVEETNNTVVTLLQDLRRTLSTPSFPTSINPKWLSISSLIFLYTKTNRDWPSFIALCISIGATFGIAEQAVRTCFEAEMVPQADEDPFPQALTGIAKFASALNGIVFDGRGFRRGFADIGRTCLGVERVIAYTKYVVEFFRDLYYKHFYQCSYKEFEERSNFPGLTEFIAACLKLREVKSEQIQNSARLCECILSIDHHGAKLQVEARHSVPLRHFITQQLRDILPKVEEAKRSPAIALSARKLPFAMYLYGKSGVGKTNCQHLIKASLFKRYLSNYAPGFANCSHSRKAENEYFDGYHGQPVMVYDDIFQKKDTAANPNPEVMEIIRAVNDDPYQLHMASVEDKKTTYFRSRFILASSNTQTPRFSSISCNTAVYRRFTVAAEVTVKPAYGLAAMDGDVHYYKVDKTKVSSSLDTDIYEIQTYNMNDGSPIKKYGYDEFVKFLYQSIDEHELSSSSTSDLLRTIAGECVVNTDNDETEAFCDALDNVMKPQNDEAYLDSLLNMTPPPDSDNSDTDTDPDDDIEYCCLLKCFPVPTHQVNGIACDACKSYSFCTCKCVLQINNRLKRQQTDLITPSTPTHVSEILMHMDEQTCSECGATLQKQGVAPDVSLVCCNSICTRFADDVVIPDNSYLERAKKLCENITNKINQKLDWVPHKKFLGCASVIGILVAAYYGAKYRLSTCQWYNVSKVADLKTKVCAFSCERCTALKTRRAAVTLDPSEETTWYTLVSLELLALYPDEKLHKHITQVLSAQCWSRTIATRLSDASMAQSSETRTMRPSGIFVRESNESQTHRPTRFFVSEEATTNDCEEIIHAAEHHMATLDMKKTNPSLMRENTPMYAQDQSSIEQYESIVYRNLIRVGALNREGVLRSMNGIFVQGRIMMTPKHLVRDDTEMLCLTNPFQKERTQRVRVKDCKFFSMTTALGEPMDAQLVALPLSVPSRPSMLTKFTPAAQFSRLQEGSLTLAGLREMKELTHIRSISIPQGNFQHMRTVTSEGGDYTSVNDAFKYLADTRPGDCGSILFAHNRLVTGKVCGFHIAGNNHNMGMGHSISRENMERNLQTFARRLPSNYSISGSFGPECSKITIDPASANAEVGDIGDVLPIGIVPRIPRPTKTTLNPSLIHSDIYEATTTPAHLKPFKQGSTYVDPLRKGMAKVGGLQEPIDMTLLDIATENTKMCFPHDDMDIQRVLTYEEALKGVDDRPYAVPINRRTSAGYPYCLKATKGKTKWLGEDDDWILNNAELKKDVNEILDKAKRNERTETIFLATLKDERRPLEKVAAGKTRVFEAAPLPYTVCVRKYFLGFVEHLMRNRISNEVCVGTNHLSMDWTLLAKHLRSKGIGTNVVAGDFSNFDGTLLQEVLWRVCDIINCWYDDSEENQQVRRVLFEEMCNSFVYVDGAIVQQTHSQPSGNPLTVVLNSIYNQIVMRYAYLLCKQRIGLPLVCDFKKHVALAVYGDDNVANITDEALVYFNQATITDALATIGMTYTDEAKTGQVVHSRRLYDVSFLKRVFRQDNNGYWRAPLDINVIREMCNWVRGNEIRAATLENVRSALLEFAIHGESLYNYEQLRLKEALAHRKCPVTFPHYLEYASFFEHHLNHSTDKVPLFVGDMDAFRF